MDDAGKLAISIEEAAKRASLGRSFVWNAVLSGELVSYRFGRRRLVRVADLDEWIRSHKAPPQTSTGALEKTTRGRAK